MTGKQGGDIDVTVHISDDIAVRLKTAGGNLSRRALEALELEELKSGNLAESE